MYTKMQNENTTLEQQTQQALGHVGHEDFFPESDEYSDDEYDEPLIKFSELPVGKSYHMYNVKPITKQDGNTSYFAEFRTKNDEYYKSWMPDSLVKKYHKLGAVECFVLNNGKKPCSKNRTYYDTKLKAIQTAARE